MGAEGRWRKVKMRLRLKFVCEFNGACFGWPSTPSCVTRVGSGCPEKWLNNPQNNFAYECVESVVTQAPSSLPGLVDMEAAACLFRMCKNKQRRRTYSFGNCTLIATADGWSFNTLIQTEIFGYCKQYLISQITFSNNNNN